MPPLILVAAGDTCLRQSLCDMLEFAGYTVITARSGYEGLDILRDAHTPPNLIITAPVMQGIDGGRFLEMVRADYRWSHIPFIFLSSQSELETLCPNLDCVADAYLAQPLSAYELLSTVKRILTLAHTG